MHTAPKALEIKSFSCTHGQKDPSQRGAFVPNEDENANYKKQVRRGTYRESENLLRSIDI